MEFIKCSKILGNTISKSETGAIQSNPKDELQMKILLVEDDKTIASGLEYCCSKRVIGLFSAIMPLQPERCSPKTSISSLLRAREAVHLFTGD